MEDLTSSTGKDLKLPNGVLRGAIIRRLLPNGPAAKAGLRENDVVVGAGSRSINSSTQLMNEVALTRPGSTIDLKVIRDGKPVDLRVVVEEQTEEKMSQFSDRTAIEDWGLVVDTLTPQVARELEVPESIKGAVILEVDRSNRAGRLRLQPGDVIKAINGKAVTTAAEAKEAFAQTKAQLSLVVQRGPVEMSLSIDISALQ